jgi:hypothetical protein
MMVHSVIAFAVVGAACFAFDASGAALGPIGPSTWAFLWRAALVVIALVAIPSTLTGISERNHMYVNWTRGHKAKLVLSLALLALVVGEIVAVVHGSGAVLGSWLGLAVVIANPLVCLALSFYGLRITLGRQSFARTSYVPDMLQAPPVDVLQTAAHLVADPARVLDVLEESHP